MMTENMLSNITFDELKIGQSTTLKRTLKWEDIELFAFVSGDVNPAHLDPEFANVGLFHGIIGHGMWTGALISAVLGTLMPGPGTIYLSQELIFKKPVRIGDEITVSLTVKSKRDDKPIVVLDCSCTNNHGETVVEGTATVLAPTEKIHVHRPELPEIEIHEINH